MSAISSHTLRSVVSELQRLHSDGRSIRPRALQERHAELWASIQRLFGDYETALAVAKISAQAAERFPFIRWDKQKIVAALRERKRKGLELSTGAIQRDDPPLAGAIHRHIGSHDAALTAAGIDPAGARKAVWWDRDSVLRELHRRHGAGQPLSARKLNDEAAPLYGAMIRFFGSGREALLAAGIDPEAVKEVWPVVWPTARLIDGIRSFYTRWWAEHPKDQPPSPRISGAEPALANAARQRFGSIGAALAAAGIEDPTYHPRRRWTPAEITSTIKEIGGTEALGRKELADAFSALPGAAIRHFGSVQKAVEAAGRVFARRDGRGRGQGHWTDESVLQALRELHEAGEDLRYRPMKQHRQPLFYATKTFFGSYVNAVKEAGINYWAMSQAQLRREREMKQQAAVEGNHE